MLSGKRTCCYFERLVDMFVLNEPGECGRATIDLIGGDIGSQVARPGVARGTT